MEAEKYTEEQLTAYLDGELEKALADKIRFASSHDSDLLQRIDALRVQKQRLVSAMDQLLDIAPQMPELPGDLRTETKHSISSIILNAKVVAAALVMLAIGGFAGYTLNSRPDSDWRDYVAAYHLLYVNSTLSNIQSNETIQTAELGRISEAIAKPVFLENLNSVDGLDYKRAQILGFEGKPLAQMTFLSKMGTPVALCIIRTETDTAEPLEVRQLEGMASATWSKNGYAYLLIGGGDQNLITDAAEEFGKIL